MILSLQGCMAVGKTTAARYLEQHCQQVQVCFEDNAAVLAEIKQRGLNKNSYADYLEIQRLFLRNELRRGQKAKKYPHAVMDFGAEEIEFYTLNYPKSRGLEWEMEAIRQALARSLRRCRLVCRSTFCFWTLPKPSCVPVKREMPPVPGNSLRIT